MTALNALVSKDDITISMDTLVSGRTKEGALTPLYFTQKFHILPSAQSVIAGTGMFDILREAIGLSQKLLVRDVSTLAELISDYLGTRDNSALLPDKGTATIYIFGFDMDQHTHAYALRSGENFNIDEIANYQNPKYILKPQQSEEKMRVLTEYTQNDNLSLELQFKKIMEQQKKWDDELDASDKCKVNIGGENVLISMVSGFQQAAILKIDKFSDYDEQYKYCLRKLN